MKNLIGLYLDDYRTPKTKMFEGNNIEWKIVRTFNEFKEHLVNNEMPDLISFDHDLSEEHMDYFFKNGGFDTNNIDYNAAGFSEKTGYDAAKHLVDYCEEKKVSLPACTVHSANPYGSDNILHFLNNYLKSLGLDPKVYKTIW